MIQRVKITAFVAYMDVRYEEINAKIRLTPIKSLETQNSKIEKVVILGDFNSHLSFSIIQTALSIIYQH